MNVNHRNKTARKDLLVHDVPPELKRALVDDAREQNCSVNEAAVLILAAKFGTKYERTGVPFALSDYGSSNLAIRGGAKLHRQIDMERARRSGTLRGIVLETLAAHYGLEFADIGRRRERV